MTESLASPMPGPSLPRDCLVSVIIVTYNGIAYIRDCIESVYAQTYPHVEIIVVDNASTDGTAQFIEGHLPQVQLIRSVRNEGFAGANNRGIECARGAYIALLNQDARADPRWLEESLRVMDSYPRAGMCAAKVLYMDEPNRINSTGILLYRDLSTVNRGLDEIDRGQYDRVEEVFGAYGAAAIYRAELIRAVGAFDEDYFMIHEEDDLAWRGRFIGWTCVYVPTAIVHHRRSASLGLYSPTKLYYGERNRLWNATKFLPVPMLLYSPFLSVGRYLQMARVHMSGRPRKVRSSGSQEPRTLLLSLVRAWCDGLRGLPRVLRKRRRIWQGRRVPASEISICLSTYAAGLHEIAEK